MSQLQEFFQSAPSEIRVLGGHRGNPFYINVFHKTKTFLLFPSNFSLTCHEFLS